MTPQTSQRSAKAGFAVLQFLIVIAIATVIAAMAIPVYAVKAKDSVLQQNAYSLELQVKSFLALDFDPTTVAGDNLVASSTSSQGSTSAAIVRALQSGGDGGSGRYVNPLSGSAAIVCQTGLPAPVNGVQPAVWVTDDQRYAYAAFTPSTTTRSPLAGTLLVVFINHSGRTTAVDIFYVDASGKRSPTVATLAT